MDLLKRIESKQARLGVIGLGYVGLPLSVEFARAGFSALAMMLSMPASSVLLLWTIAVGLSMWRLSTQRTGGGVAV
jgi:hypothetical protein